ncbi:MAG: S8 family serine peptidase [Deferribacteraceae bacterium]|jgi:subtilisin family serine protease|nr:S8 family serine peptidase [Deferribacteraceae bacterium]
MRKTVYLFCFLTFALSAYAGEYLVPIDGKMATVSRFGGDERICVADQCYMVVDESKLDWYTSTQMASSEPEPVLYYELFAAPTSDQQWGPNLEGWDDAKNNVIDLYATSRKPIAAIIDTGMEYPHSGIANTVLHTTPNGKHGYIVDDNGEIYDMSWHGTHVAGIIGGTYDGSTGVKGTGFGKVKVLPFMVASEPGSLPLTYILIAIDKIIKLKQQGNDIVAVNMSYGQKQYSRIEHDAMRALKDAGIIAVVAAGNDSANLSTYNTYPANYNVENIITVTALDPSRKVASYANYGGTTSIAAPGSAISTVPPYSELDHDGDGYGISHGTSMATPFITGAISAAFALNNTLTPQQAMHLLYNSARNNVNLSGKVINNREIDLYGFMRAVQTCKTSPSCNYNSYPPRPIMSEPSSSSGSGSGGRGGALGRVGGCAINPAASFNITALVLACGLFIIRRRMG